MGDASRTRLEHKTPESNKSHNFKGTKMGELGPGVYLRVQDHGLKDNSISSIRLVSPTDLPPPIFADPFEKLRA